MDCFSCGYEGTRRGLGSHYGSKPDHRPELTDEQHQIISGLLMGDGHINRSATTPRLRAEMINREYLEYLDDKFSHIGNGVSLSRTAEEQSKSHRESGFNESADEESYSDCYWWETMCHQELEEYATWYESGEKVFPKDLKLTPTILKHWYVCDGGIIDKNAKNERIRINLDNERKNKEKILSYFDMIDTSDCYWDEQEHFTALCFNVEQSKKLYEYMGDGLPGFEYKFDNQKI